MHGSRHEPGASDSGTQATTASAVATRSTATVTSPGDHRLVRAADRAVAGGVEQVVEPADRQLPGQHRGADEHDPAHGVRPAVTASAVIVQVTAAVGSG